MKTLIIGAGEVGNSLSTVLNKIHNVFIMDKDSLPKIVEPHTVPTPKAEDFEVLNICYPPSKDFIKITKAYIAKYKPKVTIIHSTVPPGTTDKCGEMVVHSPIHGKHPNLAEGILTYIKYLGGQNPYAVNLAKEFLQAARIKVKIVANAKTSELSKILCTTYYGWNLVFMKEVVDICRKYKVPFSEVYSDWNFFVNLGFEELGLKHFMRPVLTPREGKIGGHCVINNCGLIKSEITDFILKKNDQY